MTLSTYPLWLLLLLLLFPVLFFKAFLLAKKNSKKHPPGPRGLPIIGNLHQIGSPPHQSFHQFSKKYGDVLFLCSGTVDTIVVSSPESAKQVLQTHDIKCCSRPHSAGAGLLSYDYLDVAFSHHNDYWRQVRKIYVHELFSAKRVKSFRHIKEEETGSLISSISMSALSQSPVNLNNKLLLLTASLICREIFGMDFHGSKIDSVRFQEIAEEGLATLGSFSAADAFPYIGWIVDRVMGFDARSERTFLNLDNFYEYAIELYLENQTQEGPENIIDVLLRMEKEQQETGAHRITRNHTKAILMDTIVAAIDTSAVTMTWAMTELIRNPRVMRKAQAEIRDKIGDKGRVNEDDLESFEYMRMVIKETWRLHPPVTLLLPRKAISEFKLDGYDVFPKTQILVNVWAMGRNPSVWEDPEQFLPERFVDSAIGFKGKSFELLPFGGGRRGCPAINMGTVTVELVLANLLYCFDWKLLEGMKEEDVSMEEGVGLTAHKKTPLELVPIKYDNIR